MDDQPSLLEQGWAALQRGDAPAARELSARAFADQPNNANALLLNGLACLQCGDVASAINALAPVAAVAPQLPIVHKALADAHRIQGNLREAEQFYRMAIDLDRESVETFLGLIAVLVTAGRSAEAAMLTSEADRLAGQLRLRGLLHDQLVTRPSPVIFDVGANQGSSSRQYLSMFPSATIHAFEPHPEAFATLKERLGEMPNVILNPCAQSDACGRQVFHLSSDQGSSSFLDFDAASPYVNNLHLETRSSVEVDVLTIDSYCRDKGVEYIDFMKLDVQGVEPKVLDGAAAMLERKAIGTIQVEIIFRNFYDQPASFYEIEKRLIPRGYRLKSIFDVFPGQGAPLFQLDAVYTCLPDPSLAKQSP